MILFCQRRDHKLLRRCVADLAWRTSHGICRRTIACSQQTQARARLVMRREEVHHETQFSPCNFSPRNLDKGTRIAAVLGGGGVGSAGRPLSGQWRFSPTNIPFSTATGTGSHYFSEDGRLYLVIPPMVDESLVGAGPHRRTILFPAGCVIPLLEQGNDAIEPGECVQSWTAAVNDHYQMGEGEEQMVGGMGESDEGVWFIPFGVCGEEPLVQWETLRDTIQAVKAKRHGVPFGVYTSGLVPDVSIAARLKDDVGLSRCIVTLGTGDPKSYEDSIYRADNGGTASSAQQAFQQVCSFLALAAEAGFPVEASILDGPDVSVASDLARALGAVDVHVLPKPESPK